jgi:hypothetical protein
MIYNGMDSVLAPFSDFESDGRRFDSYRPSLVTSARRGVKP